MTHYEQRLEHDQKQIQKKVAKLSSRVEKGLRNTIEALLKKDHELAYVTIIGDNSINRDFDEINKLCHAFVARHLPSAGHLRRINSILQFNIEMERIGDYAVNICWQAVNFKLPLHKTMTRHIELLSSEAQHILHQSITAFVDDNYELAKNTIASVRTIDKMFVNAFYDLSDETNRDNWPLEDLYGMVIVYKSLSRVVDQSNNICEKTIFTVTGETKGTSPVKILFVDEKNDLSLMAELITKRIFPNSTECTSCGINPVKSDPVFVDFMSGCGFDLSERSPNFFNLVNNLDEFDIIISLQQPINSYLQKQPLKTITVDWIIDLDSAFDKKNEKQLEIIYKEILYKIQDLMKVMRGEEAL